MCFAKSCTLIRIELGRINAITYTILENEETSVFLRPCKGSVSAMHSQFGDALSAIRHLCDWSFGDKMIC